MSTERLYEEYQTLSTSLNSLEKTLKHQRDIQSCAAIPKQYRPKLLKAADATLNAKFEQEYQDIFFKHLQEVICNNAIEAELIKARISSVITRVEKDLAESSLSPKEITTTYTRFLTNNAIVNRTPIPQLQSILETGEIQSQTKPRRRPKRKHTTPAPPPTKQAKPADHFLCLGPHHPQHPP